MNKKIEKYNAYLINKENQANEIIAKYFDICEFKYAELKVILQSEFGLINDKFENMHKYNIKSLKNVIILDINDLTEGLLDCNNQIDLFFVSNKKEGKELEFSLLALEILNDNIVNHFELVEFALNTTMLAIIRMFENTKN